MDKIQPRLEEFRSPREPSRNVVGGLLAYLLLTAMIGLLLSVVVSPILDRLGMGEGVRMMVQSGLTAVLTLTIPSFLYAYAVHALFKTNFWTAVGLNRVRIRGARQRRIFYVRVVLLAGVIIAMVQLFEWVGSEILPNLSHHLRDVIESELQRERLRFKLIFAAQGFSGWTVRILALAAIPAFTEELFMRGTLQPLLIRLSGSRHIGVIVTALVFTLLHLSVVHFLGIFLYALFFGYLTVACRSILPSMILHFLNNSATLLLFSVA